MNTLYYGDNLHVLGDHIKDGSVDLIYLDPPFNSNRSYNILFKDEWDPSHTRDHRRAASLQYTGMSQGIHPALLRAGYPEVSLCLAKDRIQEFPVVTLSLQTINMSRWT